MRTPSPEKDNLLRPMVHEKIVYQILKKEGFLPHPLIGIVVSFFGMDVFAKSKFTVVHLREWTAIKILSSYCKILKSNYLNNNLLRFKRFNVKMLNSK